MPDDRNIGALAVETQAAADAVRTGVLYGALLSCAAGRASHIRGAAGVTRRSMEAGADPVYEKSKMKVKRQELSWD